MRALDALLRVDADRTAALQQLRHVVVQHVHLWRRRHGGEDGGKCDCVLLDQRLEGRDLVVAERVLPVEEVVQLGERHEHRLELRSARRAAKRTLDAVRANEAPRPDDAGEQLDVVERREDLSRCTAR
eukprot:6096897-Prymnesium_polylepis.2